MTAVSHQVLGPVLLGYDGSDAARGAIATAGRVLGGREAVVVTVWESVGSAIRRGAATTAGFVARPVARRALARAAERKAVTVWRAILDAADEEGAELIVLGSRGRSSVTSMVLGSVAYGIVNNSDRPVLIIPPGRR